MECLITADYGEKFYEFSLDCLYDKDGNMQFEVLKPESIAGITGFVSNDGGMLTFDDQALAFPLLADGYLSPVSAPWLFMRSLRSGYINACGPDGEGYLMELTDSFEEKPIQIFVWTDQNFQPVRGEMIWSGRRILSLDVIHISYVQQFVSYYIGYFECASYNFHLSVGQYLYPRYIWKTVAQAMISAECEGHGHSR